MMAIRRRKQVIPDTESTQKVYNYSAADKDFASKRAKPNQFYTYMNIWIRSCIEYAMKGSFRNCQLRQDV